MMLDLFRLVGHSNGGLQPSTALPAYMHLAACTRKQLT